MHIRKQLPNCMTEMVSVGGNPQPTCSMRVVPLCQRGLGSPTEDHIQVESLVRLAVADLTLQMAVSLTS